MKTNKNPLFYFFVTLVFLITLFGILWKNMHLPETEINAVLLNKKLPNFDLPILSHPNQHLTNSDLVGRVALLNFWASWCSACRNEHRVLLKIKNMYHVPIYGIDYRDNTKNAAIWLQKLGNPYVVSGVDVNGNAGIEFELYGTPETFILDTKGIIRYIHLGAIDENVWRDELWPIVQKLQNTAQ